MRLAPKAETKKGRRREERSGKGGVPAAVPAADQALYQALKALRMELAKEAHLPPYVIFHDKTLVELAAKRPRSEKQLTDVLGLGASKIARFGTALLATSAQHAPKPVTKSAEATVPPPAAPSNRLSATVNQTLAMHLAGKDAEAIATERRLDTATVYGHFAEAIEAGLVEARAVLPLDDTEIDEILAAFENCDTLESGKLGPAHAALDGRYDYGMLKCLLAELA
jgi:ATP-dependent DNA helicase RecQ